MKLNKHTKQVSACRNLRNKSYTLFDQLFENCYIDALTGRIHCVKCNNVVHVNLSRCYAFCPVHGMLI